jgi:hypothetical protein
MEQVTYAVRKQALRVVCGTCFTLWPTSSCPCLTLAHRLNQWFVARILTAGSFVEISIVDILSANWVLSHHGGR